MVQGGSTRRRDRQIADAPGADLAEDDEERAGRSRRPKAEVVDAILGAADQLYAERSPSAVSLREIADQAGVQHSLIHRHFGTKDELLRSVVSRASQDFRASLQGDDQVEVSRNGYRYMLDHPTLIRVMLQCVLEGEDPRRYIEKSHGFNRYAELHERDVADPAAGDEVDATRAEADGPGWPADAPPLAAVAIGVFSIGAVVAESWLLAADGMERVTPEQFRAGMEQCLALVVEQFGTDPPTA